MRRTLGHSFLSAQSSELLPKRCNANTQVDSVSNNVPNNQAMRANLKTFFKSNPNHHQFSKNPSDSLTESLLDAPKTAGKPTFMARLLSIDSTIRLVMQVFFFLMHFIAAGTLLYFWLNISLSTEKRYAASRLVQNSHYLTDYSQGLLSTGSRGANLTGVLTLATEFYQQHPNLLPIFLGAQNQRLPPLNRETVLNSMQPVSILYSDNLRTSQVSNGGLSSSPFLCMHLFKADKSAMHPNVTDFDLASWRACRAQDVPSRLVDIPQTLHSMILFSSNNFLFLLYITMFLTAVLALAFIVPVSNARYLNPVFLALVLLCANAVFVLFSPWFSKEFAKNDVQHNVLRLPVNNVVIAIFFHFVVGIAILLLGRNKDRIIVKDILSGRHTGKATHKIVSAASIFNSNNYVGVYRDYQFPSYNHMHIWKFGGKLWTSSTVGEGHVKALRTCGKQSANLLWAKQNRFNNANPFLVYGDKKKDDNEATALDAAKHDDSNVMVPLDISSRFHFFHKKQRSQIIDASFIEVLDHHMSWITVKYFEYALTAGLFLIGVLLLFSPHADTYVYQVAFLGMFACNSIAIPLHQMLVHASTVKEYMASIGMIPISSTADGNNVEQAGQEKPKEGSGLNDPPNVKNARMHASYSVLCFLVASWLFFIAGLVPYLDAVNKTIYLEGIPTAVVFSSVLTAILFVLFGVAGCIFIVGVLMVIHKGPDTVQRWFRAQNLCFELLNNVKWILAFTICVGGLATIGF
jgi:hypothetical protein